MVSHAVFDTPFGEGSVHVEGGRLVEVRLPYVGEAAAPLAPVARGSTALPGSTVSAPDGEAGRWAEEISAYFRGERHGWTAAEVDLDGYGFTPFRRAVYRALLEVPPGETVTYGELARRAGRPGAARAVGSAMAENPIAVVVPCHRVVRSGGALGRYEFGLPWKRLLLETERVPGGGGGT